MTLHQILISEQILYSIAINPDNRDTVNHNRFYQRITALCICIYRLRAKGQLSPISEDSNHCTSLCVIASF